MAISQPEPTKTVKEAVHSRPQEEEFRFAGQRVFVKPEGRMNSATLGEIKSYTYRILHLRCLE